jgi:beta-glucanase (GH16 family)
MKKQARSSWDAVPLAIRRFLILASFCLLISSAALAQTWSLAWSDEFTGTTIDTTKWTFDYGNLNVNNELEYYCGPANDPNNQSPCSNANPNVYLDGNGHLVIQAIRISSNTAAYSNSWTSARMKSENLASFQYGRIESSMQLPIGAGLWPAFWALGSNIATAGWPQCGEQDYMENIPASAGQGPTIISSTIHGPTYYGANGLSQRYAFPSGEEVDTAYHAYGEIWSPYMIQFYVDDPTKVFFVRTASDVPGGTNQWVFNQNFFLLLNLAVGGTGSWPGPPDSTTPSPATMLVDYVRQYTASPLPPPSLGTPSSITVTAGATTGNTSTVNLSSSSDIGRVYLSCSTNAPKASCAITSNDALDIYTVDFSKSLTPTATVAVTTTANTAQASLLGSTRSGAVVCVILLAFLLSFRLRPGRRGFSAVLGCILLLSLIAPSCGSNGSGTGTTGGGTTPGNYTITVNAYTVSNTGSAPDATVNIPLIVN